MARVLAIGDTHCPAMHARYTSFLARVRDKYKCNRVVHIGDIVDNASISYHEKHSGLPSASEEYARACKQVSRLCKEFPKCDLLLGNHDALTERQAVTIGLLPNWIKDFKDTWLLPKGWIVHPRFSEIEIDGVLYMHGDSGRGGQFGAMKTAQSKFQSVVMGHLHSEFGCWWYANGNARVFGLNTGCGVDHRVLAMEYGRKFTKKPILGCAVILDGHPICVPMEL